jgi:hypothetical protein
MNMIQIDQSVNFGQEAGLAKTGGWMPRRAKVVQYNSSRRHHGIRQDDASSQSVPEDTNLAVCMGTYQMSWSRSRSCSGQSRRGICGQFCANPNRVKVRVRADLRHL